METVAVFPVCSTTRRRPLGCCENLLFICFFLFSRATRLRDLPLRLTWRPRRSSPQPAPLVWPCCNQQRPRNGSMSPLFTQGHVVARRKTNGHRPLTLTGICFALVFRTTMPRVGDVQYNPGISCHLPPRTLSHPFGCCHSSVFAISNSGLPCSSPAIPRPPS